MAPSESPSLSASRTYGARAWTVPHAPIGRRRREHSGPGHNLAELSLSLWNALPLPYRGTNAEVRLPLSVAAVAGALGRKSPQGQPLRVQWTPWKGVSASGLCARSSLGLFLVQPGREIGGVQKMEGSTNWTWWGSTPLACPATKRLRTTTMSSPWRRPKGRGPSQRARSRGAAGQLRREGFRGPSGRRVPGSWVQAAAIQSLLTGIDELKPARRTHAADGSLAGGRNADRAAPRRRLLPLACPSHRLAAGGSSRLPARAIVHRLRWIALSVALLAFAPPGWQCTWSAPEGGLCRTRRARARSAHTWACSSAWLSSARARGSVACAGRGAWIARRSPIRIEPPSSAPGVTAHEREVRDASPRPYPGLFRAKTSSPGQCPASGAAGSVPHIAIVRGDRDIARPRRAPGSRLSHPACTASGSINAPRGSAWSSRSIAEPEP